MNKLFILLVLLVFWFNTSLAADYYVRPSGGSYGSEDGSSYANAWDGFANINWPRVDEGDGKLFVSGTHNEQMTVGASGEDSAPIHILSCTTSNGASTDDAGTIDGADIRNYGILIVDGSPDYSNITIDGLTLTGAIDSGVYVDHPGTNIIIQNCTITNILGTDQHDGNGIFLFGLDEIGDTFIIANNTITNVYNTGIWLHKGSTSANVTGSSIHGNDIDECGYSGIAMNRIGYLEIHKNDIYDISGSAEYGNGIGLYLCNNNNIYNNVVAKVWDIGDNWNSAPLRTYAGEKNKFYKNIVSDAKTCIHIDNSSDYPSCSETSDGNEVYYNIVHNCNVGLYSEQHHSNTKFYNNISYNNLYGMYVDGYCADRSRGNLVKNNIFSDNIIALRVLNTGTGFTFDNNLYHDTSPSSVAWQWDFDGQDTGDDPVDFCINDSAACDTSHQWTNFKSDTSVEFNSPTPADPLFVNAGTDFRLSSTLSPAYNAGADVGLTEDYEGKLVPQGSGVDIGAFEYQTDTTLPTVTINNGAIVTNSLNVLLTLFATYGGHELGDNALMSFSNDNLGWSDPEPYANTKIWTLSPGEGVKTVYVKFQNAAGDWMTEPVQDQIIYETTETACDDPQKLQPATITASSQFGPFYAKDKAVDGNPSTTWSTFLSIFKKDEFFTLDLGEIKKISGLNMYASQLFGTDYFPTHFQIEISSDNITWKVISTEQGYTTPIQPGNPDSWTFNSLDCRYVRIYITKTKNFFLFFHVAQISEIEIYGCDILRQVPLTEKNTLINQKHLEINHLEESKDVKIPDQIPPTTPGKPRITFPE